MDYRLKLVLILTGIIHLINTLGYSVRLAGVRARSLSISFSLWNVIFLVASTANTIQGPFIAKIVDLAETNMTALNRDSVINHVNTDIRLIILAATIGSIIGALLIPSFVVLFSKGIEIFNKVGSVPRVMLMIFKPRNVARILSGIKRPPAASFTRNMGRVVPIRIMILNIIVWGIYTIGVFSAIYAGMFAKNLDRTTMNLASLINGIATILLFVLVDPFVSNITDQALRNERSEDDVKSVTVYLAVTRIIGTIVAQLFFVPAAMLIVYIAKNI